MVRWEQGSFAGNCKRYDDEFLKLKVKEEDLDKQLIFKGLESQGEIVKEKYMEILSITYPES